MKRLILTSLAAAVLLMCACNGGKDEQETRIAQLRDSLSSIIAQKDSELDDMIATMNEILTGFEQINQAEGRITRDADNVERDRSQEIQENINFSRRTLAQNKERITLLESKLQQSGAYSARLSATIDQLNQQIEAKQAEVSSLEDELRRANVLIEEQNDNIVALQQDVNALSTENKQAKQTVAAQDAALHKAWYVFGTKKELKLHQIIDGGEVLRSGANNQDYFTEIDTRNLFELHLYSKGAKLLTSHPQDSYTLKRDAQKQYTLYITDQDKFWSVSRYLVIQVK